MAEWLYERGIGEARAALVERGRIVEMAIEPDGTLRAGTVLPARLLAPGSGGRARVRFDDGTEAWLAAAPKLSEGARLTVELVREAYVEPGGALKPGVARAVAADPAPGPDLLARLHAGADPVAVLVPGGEDRLEAHGWSEALEAAASGLVATPAALLRISLTPAMTLIDVDGGGTARDLALAGAGLAGATIRRLGLVGSIGVDLPTLPAKGDRQSAAAALDAMLPPPFERAAVNGFGFLHLVRRRIRPSIPELLAADPARAAARALLRRAERATGRGALTLTAAPAVIAALEAHPAWLGALARSTGAEVRLRLGRDPTISVAHAQREHP